MVERRAIFASGKWRESGKGVATRRTLQLLREERRRDKAGTAVEYLLATFSYFYFKHGANTNFHSFFERDIDFTMVISRTLVYEIRSKQLTFKVTMVRGVGRETGKVY